MIKSVFLTEKSNIHGFFDLNVFSLKNILVCLCLNIS